MKKKSLNLESPYAPTGDQPQAIEQLVKGFKEGNQCQTLLGITGSGKTFTMANIIAQLNSPALFSHIVSASPPSFMVSLRNFSRRMQLNTLYPTMIIISRRPMCRPRILTSQKIRQSTTRLIAFAIRRRQHCLNGGTDDRLVGILYLWTRKPG